MENQEGEVVHLPPAERASIMMALSMHEKGRAALKRRGYNEALVFFLEADADYKACSSTLLETVDNYALLNLDIVWCYVMLKVCDCLYFLYELYGGLRAMLIMNSLFLPISEHWPITRCRISSQGMRDALQTLLWTAVGPSGHIERQCS